MKRAFGALLCAVSSLLLGGVSHVLAGGQLPGIGWLAAAFVVLAAVGVGLSGPQRRFDVTVFTMGSIQFVLHLVFHCASMPAMEPSMASGSMGAHMDMGALDTHMDMSGQSGVHPMPASMTVAHGLAALGVSVCLVHGESMLRRLAALVVPILLFWVAPALVPVPRPRLRGPLVVPLPHGVVLARCCPLRGPPGPAPA
ncbi:hypothetical protein [Streptomyces pathocidini]|uniref:hypothetical protein n=1 Tax=Streptomyces pathocidini TaxID=1650571 RepID=UPI0006E37A78|nr:hypothetical protein [Streptomyces pathocidini]